MTGWRERNSGWRKEEKNKKRERTHWPAAARIIGASAIARIRSSYATNPVPITQPRSHVPLAAQNLALNRFVNPLASRQLLLECEKIMERQVVVVRLKMDLPFVNVLCVQTSTQRSAGPLAVARGGRRGGRPFSLRIAVCFSTSGNPAADLPQSKR